MPFCIALEARLISILEKAKSFADNNNRKCVFLQDVHFSMDFHGCTSHIDREVEENDEDSFDWGDDADEYDDGDGDGDDDAIDWDGDDGDDDDDEVIV